MSQSLVKRAAQIDIVDDLLRRVKQAATAHTEAGGYQGETTHPVKNVDDRTENAHEGSRSSENKTDVKEDQGKPSVDSTSPGTPGGQDSVQMNIGTHQSATGEDSSVETSSAKGGKEDASEGDTGGQGRGKTTHPARTNNESLEGGKYAAARNVLAQIKTAQEKGTALLAAISVDADETLRKRAAELQSKQGCSGTCAAGGNMKPATKKPEPPAKGPEKEAEDAAQAGYDLADALAKGGLVMGAQKEAQDTIVFQGLVPTVQEAFRVAEKTAAYLEAYEKKLAEAAPGGKPPGEEEGGDNDADNGGPPSQHAEPDADNAGGGNGGGGGGGGGDEEQALLQLLAGGDHMGAPGAMQDMGGGGGAPPDAGLGGAGGLGGEGGAPGGGAPNLDMLAEALAQLGITPEQLQAAATAKAAAALAKNAQAAGKRWQPKTAAEAEQLREMMKYVKEITAA